MKKKSLLAFVLYSLICWKLHDVFLFFFSSSTSIHFAFSTYSQFVRFLPCIRWTAVRSGKVNATNNKFHNAEYDTSRSQAEIESSKNNTQILMKKNCRFAVWQLCGRRAQHTHESTAPSCFVYWFYWQRAAALKCPIKMSCIFVIKTV